MCALEQGKSRNLTPLNRINSDVVSVRIATPSFEGGSTLGIDLKRTELLCRIGGITELLIRGSEETSIIPAMSGNSGGIGTAAFSIPAMAVESAKIERKKHVPYNSSFKCSTSSRLDVAVPISEIRRKLIDQGAIMSGSAWAENIDNSVQREIAIGGLKNLLAPTFSDSAFDLQMMSTLFLGGYGLYAIALALGIPFKAIPGLVGDYTRFTYAFCGIEAPRALILALCLLQTRELIGETWPEIE